MFYKKCFHLLTLYHCFSNRVRTNWNIGDKRNLLLKLKSKFGLYHVVLITPKTYPEKLTLAVVEMQQLPEIEKTDFEKKYLA